MIFAISLQIPSVAVLKNGRIRMIISDSLLIYVMDFRHHSTAPQLLRKCYLHVREEISFPIIFSSLPDVRLAVLLANDEGRITLCTNKDTSEEKITLTFRETNSIEWSRRTGKASWAL